MKPASLADLEAVLRTLLPLPDHDWPARIRDLIRAADLGQTHRAVTGQSHPHHGTGTLMSATQAHDLAPRPGVYGPREFMALRLIAHVLCEHGHLKDAY